MLCLNCQAQTNNPKFCNRSCSASFNNKGKRRHGNPPNLCLECNSPTSSYKEKYCCIKCQQGHRYKTIYIPNILNGNTTSSVTLKKYLSEINGYKCVNCSLTSWLNSKITLQLDHIDGNSDNNFPNNLRLLCPNCHSQTETYKGGNKNNPKNTKRNTKQRIAYMNKMVHPEEVESP
jgi:hypothetical protein